MLFALMHKYRVDLHSYETKFIKTADPVLSNAFVPTVELSVARMTIKAMLLEPK